MYKRWDTEVWGLPAGEERWDDGKGEYFGDLYCRARRPQIDKGNQGHLVKPVPQLRDYLA